MIVQMKKATVLVLESRKDRELSRLKRLGVLHPVIETRVSEDTQRIQADLESIQKALTSLPSEVDVEQKPLPSLSEDIVSQGQTAALEIHARSQELARLSDHLESLNAEIKRLDPWGDFNPDDIRDLAHQNVHVKLAVMSQKDFKKNRPAGSVRVGTSGKNALIALLSFGEVPEPVEGGGKTTVSDFPLPEMSVSEVREQVEQTQTRISETLRELQGLCDTRGLLTETCTELEKRLHHEIVRLGMDAQESVAYISGYVPADTEDALRQAARNNGWGLLLRDPGPDDETPTKISNPRWIRTIRPVFNMLGVIPGYRERDISMLFLLFFTVFVGMIIGDAGYGAILFIAALYAIISGKRKNGVVGEGVVLLTVLSLSTLAWGSITGNWFGYEPIASLRPFSYAVIPSFNSFDPRSTQAVQRVCFILAAVHLSIAHLWNFLREIRQKPALKAFAQLGWLSVVLGLFFLVASLFLGQQMPQYALYMIIAGMAFVFVFSGQSPETGFFGGIGKGLSNAFTIVFDGIGAFSDIISYIRLFAVGLASVAIAQAFNEMAASVGSGVVGYIMAGVILAFGHTLNLVMGGLAVVVHGVRLNLLEFSGHLGMEWTGIAYKPFAENEEHT